MAAGAPSLVVPPVAHDGLDDATVQFLLQQSWRERAAEEEEEAKEVAEVKEEEAKEVVRERRLLRLVGELCGAGPEAQAHLSALEYAVVSWYVAKTKVMKRKKKSKPASSIFSSLVSTAVTGSCVSRASSLFLSLCSAGRWASDPEVDSYLLFL